MHSQLPRFLVLTVPGIEMTASSTLESSPILRCQYSVKNVKTLPCTNPRVKRIIPSAECSGWRPQLDGELVCRHSGWPSVLRDNDYGYIPLLANSAPLCRLVQYGSAEVVPWSISKPEVEMSRQRPPYWISFSVYIAAIYRDICTKFGILVEQ